MTNLPCIPVPRRAMKNGWSPARQWAFLQALEESSCVREAARRVGMSEGSAYRLRNHPEAEDFRRAWDAAQARVWQRVEQMALDRVVNGDVEVIERDGTIVATRRRPCSDRLMIHMLQQQVRRMEVQAATLAATNAEARAAAQHHQRLTGQRADPPPPIDAKTLETERLRSFHKTVQALPAADGWDVEPTDLEGPVPPLPMPEKLLAPADSRIELKLRPARLRLPKPEQKRPLEPAPRYDDGLREVRVRPLAPDFSIGGGGGPRIG